MVSRQQNLNLICIDEFLRALRSFGINTDNLSGKTFKLEYTKNALYKTHHHAANVVKEKKMLSSSSQGGNSYGQIPPRRHHNILYVY